MGQAHDDDTSHSTKYSTTVMTALQCDKTPVVKSAIVYRVHVQCIVGHPLSPGHPI
jgi:hypothetical protein